MAVLQPEIAILDETDSGLDIDALRIVAEGVNAQLSPDLGVLAHHPLPAPAQLHQARRRARPGAGPDRRRRAARDLALRLEEEGYAPILREAGIRGRRRRGARAPDAEAEARGDEPVTRSDQLMAIVPALDPVAIRADFPIFERDFSGRKLAYLDSAATCAQAARRRRRGRATTMNRYSGQRPSRHLHDRRGGDGGLRGRARKRSPRFIERQGRARDRHSCATRPRRSTWSPTRGAARNIGQADTIVTHGDGASLQPRAVADARSGEGRGPGVRAHRRRRPAHPGRASRSCCARGPSWSPSPPSQRHGHDQSGRARWSPRPTRPARWCSSTARRPSPHLPVDVQEIGRRLLRLLRPQDARARQARARCGRGASCWRRCRRSWAAAR